MMQHRLDCPRSFAWYDWSEGIDTYHFGNLCIGSTDMSADFHCAIADIIRTSYC